MGSPSGGAVSPVLVAALGALAAGCVSFSAVQSADTLGARRLVASVEPGVWGSGAASGVGAAPHVDVSLRVGLHERVDLGMRLGSSAFELSTKVLLTPPGHPRLAVSVVPTVGGGFVGGQFTEREDTASLFNAALPVLLGLRLGEHELVLGPRAQLLYIAGAGENVVLLAGLSLGFVWRLVDELRLMPDVAVAVPVVGGGGASTIGPAVEGLRTGGAFLQLKLGVQFGRVRGIAVP